MPTPITSRIPAVLRKPAVTRTLLGLLAALLLYALLGFAVLPALIKYELQKLSPEKLQRQLSIGAVEINPFTLRATMRQLEMKEPGSEAVFASFDTLAVDLSGESLWRLAPVVQEVRLGKPYIHLVRQDAHHYNVDDLLALLASQPKSDQPARFSANNIQVDQGRVTFEDKPTRTTHQVADLKLGVPFISSLPSQVQIFVEPLLSANVNGTPLLIQGKARPFAEPMDAVVDFKLDNLDVVRFFDYLPSRPRIKLSGAKLSMQMRASFVQPKDKAPALLLNGNASLKSLHATTPDGKPVITLPELAIELRDTSVFGERIDIGRVKVNGLKAEIARDRDGRFSFEQLLPPPQAAKAKPAAPTGATPLIAVGEVSLHDVSLRYNDASRASALQTGTDKLDLSLRKIEVNPGKRTVTVNEISSGNASILVRQEKPAGEAPPRPASTQASAPASDAPWTVKLGRIDVHNWSARVEDLAHDTPSTTTIAPLALTVQEFSTAGSAPIAFALDAAVNKSGKLAVKGTLGLSPLHADLAINAKEIDILPVQPYVAEYINLRFIRASLTADGQLQLDMPAGGQLAGSYKGSATLGNLATVDKLNGNDFLRWKSLYAGGINLRLQPFSLGVDQLALADFFARIIIDPSGRINLQNILRDADEDHRSLTDEAAHAPATTRRATARTATTSTATTTAAVPAPSKMPPITIGKLTLQGGRVRFTDNFIKPNYSATLADFGGAITGLSSTPGSSANVDLRGAVNSAPLSVAGRINPLQANLFLDVKANVRGMELAPLSAYSGRYVGYGIEKGKISFEVAYRVENRTLTAQNRLILDQLTFGDRIESPSATKLPVRFAVALLRDRNGVIDVNLPIGGSLDDPQFSVGGLIVRVIVNVLTKAITQPFALLGSLFGGGEELSSIDLDAGRTAVPAAAETKLQKLAKALTDRPALKLEITGHVDPETDIAGLKRVRLERKVRAIKMRDLQARGAAPEAGSVTVSDSEYPELLTRAYRDEKFPKPRNLVGLPKTLPVEEMEKLIITNTEVTDDDLTTLGNQRAMAVKNWLLKNGQVPDDRIFLLAPKVEARDGKASGSRVDFSLR